MEVKNICIVGSGTMGSQIAQRAATSGFNVKINDIDINYIEAGLGSIEKNLEQFFVRKGKITTEGKTEILGRIKGVINLEKAVEDVQIVIECVSEILHLKQDIFQQLDNLCAPETILASNTSSFLITELASFTKRQDKVIGMHFFNPVEIMKLVEIICGIGTSNETYETVRELSVRLGKEVVECKDSPNFIVGRLFSVLCNEACKLLQEGVGTVEDIDKACVLGLGHAMGPFKTQDIANGVQITYNALNTLRDEFGDIYTPALILKKMVLAGELGVKTGKGFYKYK